MNIFSKRDSSGRFESKGSSNEESLSDTSKSEFVSDYQEMPSPNIESQVVVNGSEPSTPQQLTKMDNAREVFQQMFGKAGIERKNIILAFQAEPVNLTKAGAGTYYAKLKRQHLDQLGQTN